MIYGYFGIVLVWALLMSLARLGQLIYLEYGTSIFQDVGIESLIQAMWMGFRFDLLVVAFFWIPPVMCILLIKLIAERTDKLELWSWLPQVANWYFPFVWIFACLVMVKDSTLFLQAGVRARLQDHLNQLNNISGLANQASVLLYSVFLLTLVGLIGYLVVRQQLKKIEWANTSWLTLGGLALLTAFLARGNLSAHHLAQEHCEIGSQRIIRELCLNAVWTMDKTE